MLVLSRKLEESILVDGRVKITILQIKGRKVRVGIEALTMCRYYARNWRRNATSQTLSWNPTPLLGNSSFITDRKVLA